MRGRQASTWVSELCESLSVYEKKSSGYASPVVILRRTDNPTGHNHRVELLVGHHV